MIKEYKDERINKIIRHSFEVAVKDSEWELRSLAEWNILFNDIDKILEYVDNGKYGRLVVDSNIWWVLQNALIDVLDLYDLQLIGERDKNYMEEVITKNANYIKCRIEYADDKSQLDVIIKADDEFLDDEDDAIFFYGLSLDNIQDAIRNETLVENEWKILKVLEVMEEL